MNAFSDPQNVGKTSEMLVHGWRFRHFSMTHNAMVIIYLLGARQSKRCQINCGLRGKMPRKKWHAYCCCLLYVESISLNQTISYRGGARLHAIAQKTQQQHLKCVVSAGISKITRNPPDSQPTQRYSNCQSYSPACTVCTSTLSCLKTLAMIAAACTMWHS